jgi:IS5 family transposase
MARRDFRQRGLADSIVRRRGKKSEWLDRLDAALDWPALERIVADIYAGRAGGSAYPLLTYVKLLLLQQWYGLSDEGLEAAVDDRLSFRRFAGIPLSESVPDPSSVWRFREQLARRGLAERLLAEVNRQLDAKGLVLRRGTLIDATILDAAVRPPGGDAGEVSGRDPQAGWTKKNGKSRFGYKAHAAVDEGSGLVREAVMTPADVHDSVPADDLVQGDEEAVYADKAYDSEARGAGLREREIEPRIMHRARRNRPLKPWQVASNKAVAPVRAGVERLFATMKRAYGYRRVRHLGLARNDVQLQTLCVAINLRRALALGLAWGAECVRCGPGR